MTGRVLASKGKKELDMKKMLLTSNGLSTPGIREAFHELQDKRVENVRVLLIPTASRTEGELVYVRAGFLLK